MAKKKKKSSKKKPARVKPKLFAAQRRNEFYKKLYHIADASDALAAFKSIPKKELDILLRTRFRIFRVEAAEGHDIPSKMIHNINRIIYECFKEIKFSIFPDREKISLFDWLNVGIVLRTYLRTIPDNEYKEVAAVKKGFEAFMNYTNEKRIPEILLIDFGMAIGGALSEIDCRYYWFCYEFYHRKTIPPYMYERYAVKTQKAIKKTFRIDGINRPAYRVGWPAEADGLNWVTVKSIDLNIPGDFSEIPIDVYIQSHALLRLKERLGCKPTPELHFHLYHSLNEIRTHVMPNGQTLVEYRIHDVRVGYLVIDVVEGMALIRTFLFITNIGTPEGNKLHQMLGLNKIDMKYLEIDKLATFILTDLIENKSLTSIFAQAGCENLFKLINTEALIDSGRKQAERIAKYLNLNEDDSEFPDWDDEDREE